MKALRIFMLAMLVMAGMFVRADKQPVKFSLKEEAYIDDIPFNTEEIAATADNQSDLAQFTLKEEEYIDDIPFDTEEIVQSIQQNADHEKAMTEIFPMKEEPYINDIPFSTEQVALAAVEIKGASDKEIARSTISPLPTRDRPVAGILEIVIPVIIILGTLSYAVYEYILN